MDVVIYSDGSADTENQDAFQLMISRRRGLAATWGPAVDYETVQSTPEVFSANRQLKNEFFSHIGFPLIIKLRTAALFPEITLPTTAALSSLPALPVQQSDMVVVGTVTSRQAFLADAKTGVYSEIQIQTEQVFKGTGQGVTKGKTITLQRPGGVVRFNDGTVQIYRAGQQDWPMLHRRYVFFLRNSQIGDFDLLTGYELCGGVTYPLDGLDTKNLPFQTYSQVKESQFMKALSQALAQEGVN